MINNSPMGEFDGEPVLNGVVKIGPTELLWNEALVTEQRLMVCMEIEVDPKKGIVHVDRNGVLTRVHGAKARRQFVVTDDDLYDKIIETFMNGPDEYGTRSMFADAQVEDADIVEEIEAGEQDGLREQSSDEE